MIFSLKIIYIQDFRGEDKFLNVNFFLRKV